MDFLEHFEKTKRELKAEYDAIPFKARRNLVRRTPRQQRICAEWTVYIMQHKLSISRLGITADEARALDQTIFACHTDRHRHLEAVALRDRNF